MAHVNSTLAPVRAPAAPTRPRGAGAPVATYHRELEIVIPVYNESAGVERSVRRLHRFLTSDCPFTWRIVIADNASTDDTLALAVALSRELPDVEALHLPAKGRGRALRAAWSAADADVLCYMDVDLSTDLAALLPLVAALVSGHSDIAIGTRLHPAARVRRSAKREFISRSYNHLLRLLLRARFSDAQCGFKAIRADVARRLLPAVRDEEWFFDTELLVLSQRRGLRIHEVPVDWVEDADSRVHITGTALADLRGVARLLAASPVARFIAVGALSTIAYAGLYVVLRSGMGAGAANALALAATAIGNTAANRRLTFGVRGRVGLGRHLALGTIVFAITLGLTDGALALLNRIAGQPPRWLEVAALVLASACATATRYVALAGWVFAAERRAAAPSADRVIPSG
jgi:putative flippase GtrA